MTQVIALIADPSDMKIGEEFTLTAILDKFDIHDKVIFSIHPNLELIFKTEDSYCCDKDDSINCCDQINLNESGNCICKETNNTNVSINAKLIGKGDRLLKIEAFTCSAPDIIKTAIINIS